MSLGVLDLSGCYTASSPTRRAFLLVGVGAFDDPLLSVILLKASPFRRGGRVADGEVKRNIKTLKTTKSFCRS